MENGIPAAQRCGLASQDFPGESDARFECSFVQLDAGRVQSLLTQIVQPRLGLFRQRRLSRQRIKVGLPILGFD